MYGPPIMSTRTAITGSGVCTPESVITNEELCDVFNQYVRRENERNAAAIEAGEMQPLSESSAEFIEKASGIRQRYAVDRTGVLDVDRMVPNIPQRPDDEMSYQCEYAVAAARKALAAANRQPEDIDLVILSTSTLERAYPSISIEVQTALGIDGYGYDMTVGCSSVTFALRAATEALQCGNATRVLVVTPELTTPFLNFRDRDSHFIFGDACTAVVLERLDDTPGGGVREGAFEILSTRTFARFSSNIRNNVGYFNRCDPATQFAADKLFYQQGRRVFKDIVPLASKFIIEHIESHDLQPDQVSRYWLHQANRNMNSLIATRVLGRAPTVEEAPLVLSEYANTASAGSMIAFDHYHDDLPSGAYGLLCSFGAGYSIGSVLVRRL